MITSLVGTNNNELGHTPSLISTDIFAEAEEIGDNASEGIKFCFGRTQRLSSNATSELQKQSVI